MSDRNEVLEHKVRLLDNALYRIAHGRECEYYGVNYERRPTPCDCQVCEAKAVLAETRDWRYIGASHYRVTNGHNPRETKINTAWKNLVDDRMLGLILYDGRYRDGQPAEHVDPPSVRDWFVATSVVRWLATNVGMSVLEGAGYRYDQYDQDRATRDLLQRRQEQEQNRMKREQESGNE